MVMAFRGKTSWTISIGYANCRPDSCVKMLKFMEVPLQFGEVSSPNWTWSASAWRPQFCCTTNRRRFWNLEAQGWAIDLGARTEGVFRSLNLQSWQISKRWNVWSWDPSTSPSSSWLLTLCIAADRQTVCIQGMLVAKARKKRRLKQRLRQRSNRWISCLGDLLYFVASKKHSPNIKPTIGKEPFLYVNLFRGKHSELPAVSLIKLIKPVSCLECGTHRLQRKPMMTSQSRRTLARALVQIGLQVLRYARLMPVSKRPKKKIACVCRIEQDWNEWRKRPTIDNHSGYLLGISVFPLKTKNAKIGHSFSKVLGHSFVGTLHEGMIERKDSGRLQRGRWVCVDCLLWKMAKLICSTSL